MAAEVKSRWWSTIVYPESMKQGWEDRLKDTHLPIAISPLHDMDLNKDGTFKKPHYHVLIKWGNTTTQSSVFLTLKEVFGDGTTIPIRCVSPSGYYDYLTHKNAPEKVQYSEEQIKKYSGFIQPIDDDTPEGKRIYDIMTYITNTILEGEIITIRDITKHFAALEKWEEVNLIAKRYNYFNIIIREAYHSIVENINLP